jgi:hypothetical protein
VHAPSIDAARRNAAEAGVFARVSFDLARATEYLGEQYEMICFFD